MPCGCCKTIIVTDLKIFYVLRQFFVGDDSSISFGKLYFTQVLWELFWCMNIRTF